jgi:hypothetical protein
VNVTRESEAPGTLIAARARDTDLDTSRPLRLAAPSMKGVVRMVAIVAPLEGPP